ncbi:hypothetical protein PUR33_00090, partial [Streptomyces sp. BE282]|nr:hypothetical protein [Streptomyces sp. BE282]
AVPVVVGSSVVTIGRVGLVAMTTVPAAAASPVTTVVARPVDAYAVMTSVAVAPAAFSAVKIVVVDLPVVG